MRKHELYSTAIVAKNIFTHNGETDLREGECVGVKFLAIVPNRLYRRDEPVFEVYKDGKFYGHVYENALRDFVL